MGFYIDMINVGQGDCFLIIVDNSDGDSKHILLDGGPKGAESTVIDHIEKYGEGRIDLIIVSHLDSDHIGGLIEVVDHFGNKIKQVWVNEEEMSKVANYLNRIPSENVMTAEGRMKIASLNDAKSLMEVIRSYKIPNSSVFKDDDSGSLLDIGKLTVLNPLKTSIHEEKQVLNNLGRFGEMYSGGMYRLLVKPEEQRELEKTAETKSNQNSIVIKFEYEEFSALFTGDTDADTLMNIESEIGNINLLKVPHHGSSNGLNEELIKMMQLDVAFISTGGNNHGHPTQEVLCILRGNNVPIVCTNKTNSNTDCKVGREEMCFGTVCYRNGKNQRSNWVSVHLDDCFYSNNTNEAIVSLVSVEPCIDAENEIEI